jgi:glycosyltransferase involved in cell wall biosynthesis
VLFQVDDDLSCIPSSNHWQAEPGQLERHDAAIAASDGLIVTTPRLAKVYGPLARRTWIVPNYLPSWVGAMRPRERDWGAVRVGWAGTRAVHLHDLEWLRPQARRAMKGAIFHTVGDHTVPALLGIDAHWAHASPWQDEPKAFYRAMFQCDIGIVPLEPCPFNEAKSWLKALEFVSGGVPVVATATPENVALLQGTGAGFLAQTPLEMAERVQQLIHDRELRAQMAQAARGLGERMALEGHWRRWQQPISEVTHAEEVPVGAIRGF